VVHIWYIASAVLVGYSTASAYVHIVRAYICRTTATVRKNMHSSYAFILNTQFVCMQVLHYTVHAGLHVFNRRKHCVHNVQLGPPMISACVHPSPPAPQVHQLHRLTPSCSRTHLDCLITL